MDGWMDGACKGYFSHWILCSPVTTSPYPRVLKMGFIHLDGFKNGKNGDDGGGLAVTPNAQN
jgi:hypothetical protein